MGTNLSLSIRVCVCARCKLRQQRLSFDFSDDDFEGLDDSLDMKGLSKRDMHTLNEQRRRDSIKVSYTYTFSLVRCAFIGSELPLASAHMINDPFT